MANDYLEGLMAELAKDGIRPPESSLKHTNGMDDKERKVIDEMESITGKSYSDEQRKILEHHGNACILACAGSGKALVNGTGVLTPNGYVPIETLKVGDTVYDHNGIEQLVLGVFPQGKKKVYKVEFIDGTVIKCCSEHLWAYYDKDKTERVWRVGSTEEIMMKLIYGDKIYVPMNSDIRESIYDNLDISNKIIDLLTSKNEKEYANLLGKQIGEDIGLAELYIPDELKYRHDEFWGYAIQLLNISFKSERLANDIKDIILMQGYLCKVVKSSGSKWKVVSVDTDVLPYYSTGCTHCRGRRILKIEETDDYEEMTCIKVSGISELFLTENCVVTHNTTISTHLIAKRIKTGEIVDVNKLVYTTYSKAGATEMKERLDALLKQLGMSHISQYVQVRTLHSFFLQIIRLFGINAKIISESERLKYVKQACRDAEYPLKDDDLMLISNLLSYQVNNLLSDKKTLLSYVNTLENLEQATYSKIRAGYANQKTSAGVIDYDDMQTYLYIWLVKYAKSANEEERKIAKSVRDYCKAMWTDFYIDEAQDVSKIQFEIIKAMVTSENDPSKLDRHLVFIGDDDQCLVEGTMVTIPDGTFGNVRKVPIETIQVGDNIVTAQGHGVAWGYGRVTNISKKYVEDIDVYTIETYDGKKVTATGNHIGFSSTGGINTVDGWRDKANISMFGDGVERCIHGCTNKSNITYWDNGSGEEIKVTASLPILENIVKRITPDKEVNITAKLTSSPYSYGLKRFDEIEEGMDIPVYLEKSKLSKYGEISDNEVMKITKSKYTGYVYDLEVPYTRNFIANDIVVHNCIYQWRGGDPSIILGIGPLFDIKTFVLSTNYRCYNEIVDYAATGIKYNSSRYQKDMNAFMKGGNVKILPSAKHDLCSLSNLAVTQIKKWIESGDRLSDIAVLSRNNFHLAILSNMLMKEGIYCTMTEDMKLTKSYMYKDIRTLIDISETSWKPQLTREILWKLCRYMGMGTASIIADFQNSGALSLEDALGWLIKKFIDKDIDFDKTLKINLQAEEKMRYHMNKLTSDTIEDLEKVYYAISSGEREKCLITLLFQYLEGSKFMYKSKDKDRSIKGLVSYIIQMIKSDGIQKMLDFLKITEQLEGGYMVVPGEKLTLSTIHSAKGREWKNVIMFACDNISQPSIDGIYSMIEDGVSVNDIYSNIDEERRLFYVGNTRAKENLLVLTYGQPSIFILEALGLFGKKTGGNNDAVIELVNNPDTWILQHKEFIDKHIHSEDSKYYCDLLKEEDN